MTRSVARVPSFWPDSHVSSFIVGFDAAADWQHRMSHCDNNQPLSCKVASVFRNADDCPSVCRVGSAWQSHCQQSSSFRELKLFLRGPIKCAPLGTFTSIINIQGC